MANMLEYDIVVSMFKLQSGYYIYFQANNHLERYELLYPFINGLNSTTIHILHWWLWH